MDSWYLKNVPKIMIKENHKIILKNKYKMNKEMKKWYLDSMDDVKISGTKKRAATCNQRLEGQVS